MDNLGGLVASQLLGLPEADAIAAIVIGLILAGAAVVLGSPEEAQRLGAQPLARILGWGHAGVEPRVMGLGPVEAVPIALRRAGVTLDRIDVIESNEAFAAQVLCTLRAWEDERFCRERLGLAAPLGAIDRAKLNVTGSSLAIGHPFAATGARILGSLAICTVLYIAFAGVLTGLVHYDAMRGDAAPVNTAIAATPRVGVVELFSSTPPPLSTRLTVLPTSREHKWNGRTRV